MNYIIIGKGDFSSPEKIIVDYQGHYFQRRKNTDWEELTPEEKEDLLSGRIPSYGIEESQKDQILLNWGGSKEGYKNLNIHHRVDNGGYGEEYDD